MTLLPSHLSALPFKAKARERICFLFPLAFPKSICVSRPSPNIAYFCLNYVTLLRLLKLCWVVQTRGYMATLLSAKGPDTSPGPQAQAGLLSSTSSSASLPGGHQPLRLPSVPLRPCSCYTHQGLATQGWIFLPGVFFPSCSQHLPFTS